jgi:magnesium-transporting ATPase (P-type)
MITGDIKETAESIAKEIGIIRSGKKIFKKKVINLKKKKFIKKNL